MFSFGVIDPAKVVRNALEDAALVAGVLVINEATVADLPKNNALDGGGMPDTGGVM